MRNSNDKADRCELNAVQKGELRNVLAIFRIIKLMYAVKGKYVNCSLLGCDPMWA
jgi:hypothetical protein